MEVYAEYFGGFSRSKQKMKKPINLPGDLFGVNCQKAYIEAMSQEEPAQPPPEEILPGVEVSPQPDNLPVLTQNSNLNLADYIILECRQYSNGYFYPDLLVAKHLTLYNHNWYQSHEKLQQNNQFMLTIRQFVDFVNLLKSGTAYDGQKKQISSQELNQIQDEILTQRSPGRVEWLDADFKYLGNNKQEVASNQLGNLWLYSQHRLINGKIEPQYKQHLENCLTKNCYADLFDSANNQGLPTTKTTSGLYYHSPMKENKSVARFWARSSRVNFNCGGNMQDSLFALRVRAAQQYVLK